MFILLFKNIFGEIRFTYVYKVKEESVVDPKFNLIAPRWFQRVFSYRAQVRKPQPRIVILLLVFYKIYPVSYDEIRRRWFGWSVLSVSDLEYYLNVGEVDALINF